MSAKKLAPLTTNSFQYLDNDWYLYRIDNGKLTPNEFCNVAGTNLNECTISNTCTTDKGYHFYCDQSKYDGQPAQIKSTSGPDGILCDPDEQKSAIPYVINVKENGDGTAQYICSNTKVDGDFKCDNSYGCIQASDGTMTAAQCLDTCQTGYKCENNYTCTSCTMSESDPDCKVGNCKGRMKFCEYCGRDDKCNGYGTCINGTHCKCDEQHWGPDCKNPVCELIDSGTCEYKDGKQIDNCNSSYEECPYKADFKIDSNGDQTCKCIKDFNKDDVTDIVHSVVCPDWQASDSPFKSKSNSYWTANQTHKADGDAICRDNYGKSSYQFGNEWHDCGAGHGGKWNTTMVRCRAPKGSIENIPWNWYANI